MEAPLKIGDTSAVVVMKARDMKFRDAAVTIGDKSIGVTVTLTEDNRSFDRLDKGFENDSAEKQWENLYSGRKAIMVRTNTARWSVWVETETTPDVYEEKMVALDDGTPDTTAATLRTDTIGRSEDEIFITVTTDQGVQKHALFRSRGRVLVHHRWGTHSPLGPRHQNKDWRRSGR